MSYSQKPLIELMKQGLFPGERTVPKHIETVISNVFVFADLVYKVYKNDNEFFNTGFRDISGKAERFSFTERDFAWNNALSPAIYLKIIGVAVINEKITEVSLSDAEELMIIMKRIDTSDILFEKIINGQISHDESFVLGTQLAESLKKVQKELPTKHNFHTVFETRIADLRDWIKSVADDVSPAEAESYTNFLDTFRQENHEWFKGELTDQLTFDGDFHSHNANFSQGTLSLMDTFPPKERWLVGHRSLPVYRMGVDIWALTGEQELFEHFVKGYEQGSGLKIDRKLDPVYVVYSAALMVSYLYMLQRTDETKKSSAQKFHQFIRDYFKKIKK